MGLVTLFAAPAMSEKLSHEWQADRDYYNRISDNACAGNREAYQDLVASAVGADLPVAMNDLYWMHAEKTCQNDDFVRDMSFAIGLQKRSAEAGYPLALAGYAHRLMMGDKVRQHTGMAVNYFDRAIHAGYGTAALELAEYYLTGEYVEKNYGLAVHYLRLARADNGKGDQGPDPDEIASLARRLDAMTATQAGLYPITQQSKWTVDDNAASWRWVSDGRLRGEVSVVTDVNTGALFYSFYRESNDPIIHFMGASVDHANGTESELHFGECGANNCLETFYFDNNVQATLVWIPIIPSSRTRTLEALKSGDTVTFRYQTRDSFANNNRANFTLSLKGSRTAIEQVERMSAVIANEYNRPKVDYSEPDNPVAFDDGVDDSNDRSQLVDYNAAAVGSNNAGATAGAIVMSYDDAAIIDHAARSAGGKFSKAPVTCYNASQGKSSAGIMRALNQGHERFNAVNAMTIANPLGALVLQYVWGGVVFEHVYDNRTEEVYSVIEQRDYYSGKTECVQGDLEYSSPEAALTGMIALSMAREARSFDKRTVAGWKQRILRPDR